MIFMKKEMKICIQVRTSNRWKYYLLCIGLFICSPPHDGVSFRGLVWPDCWWLVALFWAPWLMIFSFHCIIFSSIDFEFFATDSPQGGCDLSNKVLLHSALDMEARGCSEYHLAGEGLAWSKTNVGIGILVYCPSPSHFKPKTIKL